MARRRSFRTDFTVLSVFFVLILISATIFYRLMEGWSWMDSFYFSSTTLITIGHAELLPSTDLSKLFTIVLSFVGVATFLGLITLVAGELLKEEEA
uniref:Two pore domain potassium channel family protein n=1 Tax=candidate division WWE3 bacterium TaxID=2053526 RepID=A0A832E0X0_UNCKA